MESDKCGSQQRHLVSIKEKFEEQVSNLITVIARMLHMIVNVSVKTSANGFKKAKGSLWTSWLRTMGCGI